MTNRVKLGCVAHVRDSDDKGNEFNPIYRFAAGFLPCGRAVSGVRAAALRALAEERIFLAEFDCCHTHPMFTMPIGCQVELNATDKTVKLLESPLK